MCEVESNNRDLSKNEYVPTVVTDRGGYLESLRFLSGRAAQHASLALQRSPQFCLTLQALAQ